MYTFYVILDVYTTYASTKYVCVGIYGAYNLQKL